MMSLMNIYFLGNFYERLRFASSCCHQCVDAICTSASVMSRTYGLHDDSRVCRGIHSLTYERHAAFASPPPVTYELQTHFHHRSHCISILIHIIAVKLPNYSISSTHTSA